MISFETIFLSFCLQIVRKSTHCVAKCQRGLFSFVFLPYMLLVLCDFALADVGQAVVFIVL